MTKIERDQRFVEKIKTVNFNARIMTPVFKTSNKDALAMLDSKDTRYEICKDPIKYRTIMKGNASDKTLKKDCEQIERYKHDKEKKDHRESKLKKIKNMKARYKAKYGYEP